MRTIEMIECVKKANVDPFWFNDNYPLQIALKHDGKVIATANYGWAGEPTMIGELIRRITLEANRLANESMTIRDSYIDDRLISSIRNINVRIDEKTAERLLNSAFAYTDPELWEGWICFDDKQISDNVIKIELDLNNLFNSNMMYDCIKTGYERPKKYNTEVIEDGKTYYYNVRACSVQDAIEAAEQLHLENYGFDDFVIYIV